MAQGPQIRGNFGLANVPGRRRLAVAPVQGLMYSPELVRRYAAAAAWEEVGVVEKVPRSDAGLTAAAASWGLFTGLGFAVAMRVTE
jgi:hypothetical protein